MRRELRALAREVFLAGRHAHAVAVVRLRPPQPPVRLNLGSHLDLRVGWVNVDPFVRGTLGLDLRRPLPFSDASVELVHAEHFLEHVEHDEARRLLAECYRMLVPGGALSVSVPDAEPALRAYARGETTLDEVNHLFRGGGTHLYAYDEAMLARLMREAGFEARRREFDSALDLEIRRHGTLRMLGRKP
jgi:predicted SAM-dependent methyltransferase